MQLLNKSGSMSVRRNTHMRSLWVEYPRKPEQKNILASLFNMRREGVKVNLPILKADDNGVKIRIPSFLTGMFYLKIQDGDEAILRQIAIQ